MSLPQYPDYKETGIAWLGPVPAHWSVAAVGYRYEVLLGKMLDERRITGEHLAPYLRNVDVQWDRINIENLPEMDFSGNDIVRYALTPGDLLVCEGGEVGRAAIWPGDVDECYYQKALHRLRCWGRAKDVPRFMLYLLRAASSLNVFTASEGKSTIAHLTAETLRRYRFAFPSFREQKQIVDFLDDETSKIDALISEQEKLLELLAEKRQATISHAVTRGLNPDAPMKNSGVEWFEAVPEHWTVCTLRRVVLKIEQGWSPECDNRPADDGEWGVLKTGCVNGGIFNAAENKALPDALEPAPALEIRDGDLLMSRASGSPKLVGSAAYITNPPPRLMLSDKIFRLHLRDWVVPRFLAATFTSAVLRLQIEKSISGAEGLANNLPQSDLKGFWIVVPPRKEQEEIVAFLDTETAKLDALKTDAERAIDLLKERRKALISAAVTGKIDVREHPSALAEAA